MGCGTTTIKYLLFIFNLIFCLGGLVILVLGAVIQWNINFYEATLSEKVTVPAIVLIVVGSIIFITALLGCCGVLQESHCMITTFAVILIILFLIQIVGGALAFAFQDEFNEFLRTGLKNSMKEYNQPNAEGEIARQYWDTIQTEFKCCGVDGPTDWTTTLSNNGIPPASCGCDELFGNGCLVGIYTKGCYQKLSQWLKMTQNVLGGVAIGVAAVELIGAVFALYFASSIRRRYGS
ncbi:Hypothetical predicted protein [Cloeon dipterum]|uniref:Tetraspanin n=1 Tax=Cloeon dipterum TaxID=197152 RepID=A0A8S1DEM6_9INSE|nr:Hypothetical predicted protein [Cloeon dipterum]